MVDTTRLFRLRSTVQCTVRSATQCRCQNLRQRVCEKSVKLGELDIHLAQHWLGGKGGDGETQEGSSSLRGL